MTEQVLQSSNGPSWKERRSSSSSSSMSYYQSPYQQGGLKRTWYDSTIMEKEEEAGMTIKEEEAEGIMRFSVDRVLYIS